jgi:hypothetical protein
MLQRRRWNSRARPKDNVVAEKFSATPAPTHSRARYAFVEAHSPTRGAIRSASSEEHAMPIQDSRYQIDLAALESPAGGERSIAKQEAARTHRAAASSARHSEGRKRGPGRGAEPGELTHLRTTGRRLPRSARRSGRWRLSA